MAATPIQAESSTLGSDLSISVPVVGYSGGQFSLSLTYHPTTDGLVYWKLANLAESSSSWDAANAATLDDTLKLVIPGLDVGGTVYTLILQLTTLADDPAGVYFVLTNAIQNRAGAHGYSESVGTLAPYTAPTPKTGSGKRLLAIYVVGSDLEGNQNAGTTDFGELIKGYNALSSTDTVDVIIAFGGAKKPSWKGMKFCNMTQLIADSQNSVYGDETGADAYLYKEDRAHMGDASSLKLFLSYVKEGYQGYSSRFVVLWDHGASYQGFGNDENYDMDGLSLDEINSAFADSAIGKIDVIGFDACLMASMEVAKIVKTHASYMLASEETEPGHGWQWEAVIKAYTEQTSVTNAMKAIIDNFVTDVHEYKSTGKTLSVVDLTKFDDLASKCDALFTIAANAVDGVAQVTKADVVFAAQKAQPYGASGRDGSRLAIDLLHLANLLKSKTTAATVQTACDDVIGAVQSFVIHTANDGTNPSSFGISINAPGNAAQYGYSSTHTAFLNKLKGVANGDTTAPQVTQQQPDTPAANEQLQDTGDYDSTLYGDESSNDGDWGDTGYWGNTNSDWDGDWDEGGAAWTWDSEGDLGETYDNGDLGETYDDDGAWFLSSPSLNLPFLAGERAAFVAGAPRPGARMLSTANLTGIAATFVDENLAGVTALAGYVETLETEGQTERFLMVLAEMEAYATQTDGRYFAPKWNKSWYVVKFDASKPAIPIPAQFVRKFKNGSKIYTVYNVEMDYIQSGKDYTGDQFPKDSEGNGLEYAKMELIVNESNSVVDYSILTYKILYKNADDTDGYILFDKSGHKLSKGDQVCFYADAINLTVEGDDAWMAISDIVTFTREPAFAVQTLSIEDDNGDLVTEYVYSMRATDLAGNTTVTTPATASDQ